MRSATSPGLFGRPRGIPPSESDGLADAPCAAGDQSANGLDVRVRLASMTIAMLLANTVQACAGGSLQPPLPMEMP